MTNNNINILVCPLDWGLGHATRCVPLIRKFIAAGANVIIGADNRPLAFLEKEFPSLQFIRFQGYDIRYQGKGSMAARMFLSFPHILRRIRKEHKYLQKIISDFNIDIVVSDNRYGLWSNKTKCIFITHQLKIKCPGWLKLFEYILLQVNKYFINKYDECWIPDFKGEMTLSGDLSKNYKLFTNVHFIGLLSRFSNASLENFKCEQKYDALFILSGPEPQRTIFENIILDQVKDNTSLKILIVRGITEATESKNISENVSIINHLETNELVKAISESAIIVCRPGYSSIMDIAALGKRAVFVSTPGQTEQEYLAVYYKKKNLFFSVNQKKFNLREAIDKSRLYSGLKIKTDYKNLDERINFLLIPISNI